MAINYAKIFNRRATPQSQPIPGSTQVLNSAGILIALNAPISESDAKRGRHGKFFIVEPNRDQLEKIAGLIDSGLIKPVIAGTTPLSRAREAFELAAAGHTRGKLILEVVRE